jgi:hypothetical protein
MKFHTTYHHQINSAVELKQTLNSIFSESGSVLNAADAGEKAVGRVKSSSI